MQEKANLARIRDNQRRSRARRKEYLQELEARLRQCELQGIEASAEIQLAARRVADENRKLRILLGQHGVGDDIVETFLQSTASPDRTLGGSYCGGGRTPSSGAVQVLEHLMIARKPCCSDGNTCAAATFTNSAQGPSRDSSTTGSMSTVQSLWDPPFVGQLRSQNDIAHLDDSERTSQQQFVSPPTTASRTGSVVSSGRGGSLAQQQQQQPASQPRNRVPSITSSMVGSPNTATTSSQNAQPLYDYYPHSMHPSFHSHQQHLPPLHPHSHAHTINNPNALARAHTQPHALGPVSQSSQYRPVASTSATIGGTYSCASAADMITTIAGGDPAEVRTDLGCLPNGMECEVDNQLVFNVMDRYTG